MKRVTRMGHGRCAGKEPRLHTPAYNLLIPKKKFGVGSGGAKLPTNVDSATYSAADGTEYALFDVNHCERHGNGTVPIVYNAQSTMLQAQWQLLAKQTDIGQSRTSVLTPLQWTLAILLLGMAILIWTRSPAWLVIGLGAATFSDLALLGIGYIYFMIKNPDALRSEAFSLQKLAIERGLYGDSLHGAKTIDATEMNTALTVSGAKQPQREQQGS